MSNRTATFKTTMGEFKIELAEALGYAKSGDQSAAAFRALIERAGVDRSLAGEGIEPEKLARVMMSAENMPMLENNARPISKTDALELARRILAQ